MVGVTARLACGAVEVAAVGSVEVAVTIAAKHLASGLDILNRETKSVKFYGTVVITGKLSNREQVTDE